VRRVAESITGVDEIREELRQEQANGEYLSESVAELERGMFEPGYIRLTAAAAIEFSAAGLVQIRAVCRLFSIKNSLVKRGLALRTAYVWGQGVEIAARANGKGKAVSEQDVQAVVGAFLADDANARAATGSAARARLETALGTDGEVYFAAVTRPMTGDVQLRVILADEIAEVISNPDDRSEPWYYLRRWDQKTLDISTGTMVVKPMTCYYPAMGYRPATRPRTINSSPVQWDTPVLHVYVNAPEGWDRGIPDAYAAVDWAKAYKEFLEDWARLMRSLSRFAWKATTPGNKSTSVRTKLAQQPTRSITGEPNLAGATAILPPDVALEAISKSGATIDAESGRPLAMMVASALGVPVTMLLSDPGQTGARATAETLDQPTELEMSLRRELWSEAYRRLLRYVIAESVRAPQGKLKGKIKRDAFTGRETVILDGNTDDTIDIVWPALDKVTPDILIKAISEAAGVGVIPPEQLARLLLQALGVRDVDAILDELTDKDGNFQYPRPPNLTGAPGAGQAAADAARGGGDPAATAPGGPMAGDDTNPDDPEGDDADQSQDPEADAGTEGDRRAGS
jgi:hypothetical protein